MRCMHAMMYIHHLSTKDIHIIHVLLISEREMILATLLVHLCTTCERKEEELFCYGRRVKVMTNQYNHPTTRME